MVQVQRLCLRAVRIAVDLTHNHKPALSGFPDDPYVRVTARSPYGLNVLPSPIITAILIVVYPEGWAT